MCLYQVFKDIKTAIISPPKGPLDREILNSRLSTYWVRVQYIAWNILATACLYSFGDSLLHEYLNKDQIAYIIVFHSIQAIAITAYFITSCKDPGYIEKVQLKQFHTDSIHIDIDKKEEDKSTDNDNDYKYLDMNLDFDFDKNQKIIESNSDNKSDENIDFNFPYSIVRYVPEYNHDIKIDPDAAPTNFCWRCKFIRPIRSKHCYDCDRCVGKFDHHCPMVGNCVAANNHRYFVLFMTAQTIVVLWTFYISLNTLFQMDSISMTQNDIDEEQTVQNSTRIERGPFGWFFRIVFFVAIFFAVFVTVGLSGYHIYLAFSNQTTYEMIKPQIVESYIKDELRRKKKFTKKQQKHHHKQLKQLTQLKQKEIEREKELKRQQKELQKQIDELARYNDDDWERDEEDEKKYNSEIDESNNENNTDSGSSSDDTSDDLVTLSEKVLLFEPDRQKDSKLKRIETPKIFKTKDGKNVKKQNRKTVNYTDAYRNYFDEGFFRNMYLFLTATCYPEWITPLPCTVIKKRSSR